MTGLADRVEVLGGALIALMYKPPRRNAVRDQIVELEVRKLELRQARMRQAERPRRRPICQAEDRR